MVNPKEDEKSQKERFIEQARKSEADESGEAFERAFRRVVPPKTEPESGSRGSKGS